MYTGGIAAEVRTSCLIINCAGIVTITAKDNLYDGYVGGIAGLNTGLIDYCASEAYIMAKDDNVRVGGIAGVNQDGTLSHCLSIVQFGVKTKTKYIGAVTGDNKTNSSTPGTITECMYLNLASLIDPSGPAIYKGIGGRKGSTDNDGNKGVTSELSLDEMRKHAETLSDEYAICKRAVIDATSLGGDDSDANNTNTNNDEERDGDSYEETSTHGSSSGCDAFNFNALILAALCLGFMTRRFKL